MKSIGNKRSFTGIRCVFLDRDGVINRKPPEGRYVSIWEQFEILPAVEEAIARLNATGKRVVLISNQRGVALGLYTAEDVELLHRQLADHLASYQARIDGFYFCPHDRGTCECRKPATGLFDRAVRDFPGITAGTSVVIGDSLSDVQAAKNFGSRSILITGDPDTRKAGFELAQQLADAVAGSLSQAVDLLTADDGD